MKKITFLLIALVMSLGIMAQSTCNQTFSVTGFDDAPTVLTITGAEINCANPATPTALTLTNSTESLTNNNCETNGTSDFGDWYVFTLSVTGGASDGLTITGCAGEFDGTDITGFTSLTITSADIDAFQDSVTIEIDVESTFVPAIAPNCDSVLDVTTDVSVAGDISWSQATGGASSYDVIVGTSTGAGDVFALQDVGNVTILSLGILPFATTYFVTITPKNANGSATGCTEQSFTTEPMPPVGQSCFNPITAVVETDCSTATPNTIDFASSVDVGPYSCDGSTGNNNGAWIEFTSSSAGGVTINSTDESAEYVVLDDCNGTEIACGIFAGNSAIVILSSNTVFKLAVWKDGATTGTTDICIEEYILPNPPQCAETPIMPMDGATGVDASTNGEVTFSWSAPSSGDAPTGYEIFLGTESGNLTSLGVTSNVSEPITNIEGGTTYYWQAVPENPAGSATGCPEWSFTTAPIAPPTTIGTITINSCGGSDSLTNTYVIGEVTWVELVVVADGCDFSFNTLTSTIGDSELGIYTQAGAIIASNDDIDNTPLSELTATGFPAGTYYLAASSFNTTFDGGFGVTTTDTDDVGDITITVTSLLSNDECAGAEAITLGDDVSGNNTGATDSMVAGSCFTGNIRDVWYAVDADAVGEIYVNGLTAGFQYAIYSACGGNELSCNAGATGLTDGTTYYVRITDDGTGTTRASGAFTYTSSSSALSATDFDDVNSFKYYPNPVNNILTLDAQNNIESVVAYNMLGQEVLRLSPNTVNAEVDMSSLVPGAYFVKVSIQGATKTVRVIKQ